MSRRRVSLRPQPAKQHYQQAKQPQQGSPAATETSNKQQAASKTSDKQQAVQPTKKA
ncbi:hypothetical protein PGTUg99_004676 [Puccinia graminis f. sp. tritici]|uniref:Uncharacterized protein n=1 Tax=Puccinia graminis f. sp. tritici TaxID=56615 RepID=A0A5B0SH38_PUCGR|nr:hypothetical protein PGTUg99_004676 [Puccinia graminis f. sp. tritici]